MQLRQLHHHATGLIRAVVPAAVLRMRSERRFFASRGFQNLYLGKFASFAECRAYANGKGLTTGYALDHDDWARTQSVLRAHDYPILYWLGRLLAKGDVVVDFGGSVGVCFYAFRQRLEFPQDLSWVVCELPEPVEQGRKLAQERDATGLSFTTDRGVIDGCSLLLCAGVLQFIETPLADILAGLQAPPPHVLVNRIALTRDTPAFFTLQHTGRSVSPVRIDNLDDFVRSMGAHGYTLIDQWKCFENSLQVPQHDECRLEYFHGMYFRTTQRVFGPSASERSPARAASPVYESLSARSPQ